MDEDQVRLRLIADPANDALAFCSGKTRADLDAGRLLMYALVSCVEIIGEAANHCPAGLGSDTLNRLAQKPEARVSIG